jgi:hypothetical protein
MGERSFLQVTQSQTIWNYCYNAIEWLNGRTIGVSKYEVKATLAFSKAINNFICVDMHITMNIHESQARQSFFRHPRP